MDFVLLFICSFIIRVKGAGAVLIVVFFTCFGGRLRRKNDIIRGSIFTFASPLFVAAVLGKELKFTYVQVLTVL